MKAPHAAERQSASDSNGSNGVTEFPNLDAHPPLSPEPLAELKTTAEEADRCSGTSDSGSCAHGVQPKHSQEPHGMSSYVSGFGKDASSPVDLGRTEPECDGLDTWLADSDWSEAGSQSGAAMAAKATQHTEVGVKKERGLSTILGAGPSMGACRSGGQSARHRELAASPAAVRTGRDTQPVYVSSIHALYKDWCSTVQLRHRGGISGPVNLEKGTLIRATLDGSLRVQRLAARRAAEPQKLWLDHLDLGECCKIEVWYCCG
jgi:hypothetical protein